MISSFFGKLKQYVMTHKIVTIIVVIALVWGGYAAYAAMNQTVSVSKYVVQTASQSTVIASVSGTGQVDAQTTIDVKPQVSETVTKVYVQPGDAVTAGQVLVQLDTTNEEKALTQAQLSLQSAQLALAKLNEAPATTTLEEDQDAVTQAQQTLVTDQANITKDYQSGFDSISSAFIDFQTVMTGLQDFVTGYDINKSQQNPNAYVDLMPTYLTASTAPYATALQAQYNAAEAAYQQNLADYHAATRNSDPATLDALFSETENTAKTISDAVKAGKDLLNYVVNNYPTSVGLAPLPTITTTYQNNLSTYTTTVDNDVSNVAGTQQTIANDKDAQTNDTLSLQQKQDTLTALQAGPDALDVQSQNLSIEQQQISLQDAQQNLDYDTIRAPIAGIVATVPAIVGETVPDPAVSIVSQSEIAEVTLNEIDAAKVSVGDKATLTFDAFPDLSLAGSVVELDPVGTVSQGVVNYNVQIGFTQPADTSSTELVKPGMSVTADIVTQVDQNVIAVPNAAVHTSGTSSYMLEPAMPVASSEISASASGGILLPSGTKMVPVTVGIANDTLTEIDSGLNVGDQIITQTITTTATASTKTTTGTSALSALTGGGARTGAAAGGGTFRGGGAGIP
jgi:multidrug efflux pump subunit AcrA (membrane-fusion protein)